MKAATWIIIGISIIIISVVVNNSYPKQSIHYYKLLQNLKFPTSWLTQAELPPSKSQLTQVPTPISTFKTFVPPSVDRVFLEFAYLCEPACDQLWLEIAGDQPQDTLTKFLIYHPLLDNLTWFYTSDNTLQFYQRNGSYPTPVDFFQTNNQDYIYTEPEIARLLKLPSNRIKMITEITNQQQDIKYILTTYQFSKNQGSWRLGRAIDVRDISRDSDGYITWRLIHVNASHQDHPQIWMSQPNISFADK